ncbi:MAG: ATP-binding cassette domain-containing protein [Bacteroidales bacterium]|nr:ATP-binding cassette domain-containing protein [Bacteroidales bacterium]MDD4216943.1 ATP-binding cassette domain-containing protein [Bacteroidales bacterium]MDY0140732.1 ATP-binding cassette domain-containing protein [Bacteroidales bacterium]
MDNESIILLKTENLSVYQEDTLILDDVNIDINLGEFVYLIGKVGSGKTSLLKTLYAELPIIEGSANVAGYQLENIKRKHIPLLRRKIGMVFQDFELMSDRNVYENLRFVLKATDWKSKPDIDIRISEVLESVGMISKKLANPGKLSGGEKQSISIARAILNNPPVIFADEPTGNLDPDSASQIMDILYKLKDAGKSVVMVTHNYNILKKYPGKVYNCENGKITHVEEETIDFVEI